MIKKIWNASGARGFFGEGYWFHKFLRPYYGHSASVAKTVTSAPIKGNMPLTDNSQPKELFPDCIKVNYRKGLIINAVGLSNYGAEWYLSQGIWQSRLSPFIISFAGQSLDVFVDILAEESFNTAYGLQLNFSCPNVEHDWSDLVAHINEQLEIAESLGVPLIPKINILMDPLAVKDIHLNKCFALNVSNTIPWGKLKGWIDWHSLFGEVSPLAKYGGGGLSGSPIIEPICKWLSNIEINCPIVSTAGQSVKDSQIMINSGATYLELGSISILRPWRMKCILQMNKIPV